jgi:callose synthase
MYCHLLIRLLETVHGGNNRKHEGITPLDQQEQEQLFTKAIEFPVKASDAWKEKVISQICFLFIVV